MKIWPKDEDVFTAGTVNVYYLSDGKLRFSMPVKVGGRTYWKLYDKGYWSGMLHALVLTFRKYDVVVHDELID